MPGNAAYTYNATSGLTVTYFNMHGDALTTANAAGTRLWEGRSGPHGEAITTSPANTNIGGTSYGWHGADERVTDRGSIVHMGARPYSRTHGRFLAVDPIEGGCANDYTYVYGDPVNEADTAGTGIGSFLKSVVKVGAPVLGCAFGGPLGCAAGLAVSSGIRVYDRIQECGWDASFRDNVADVVLTAATAGLVATPALIAIRHLKTSGVIGGVGGFLINLGTRTAVTGTMSAGNFGIQGAGAC